MRRTLLVLALFAATASLGASCERSHSPPEPETIEAPEPSKPAPVVGTVDGTIGRADSLVERARIGALPLKPLPPTVARGVALPLYPELPELRYEAMVDAIAKLGASHVSVVLSWNQRTIFDNKIAADPDETPTDARVGEVLAAARQAGLKTMMFPILHVELRGAGEWRGKLKPSKPQRWEKDYRAFILHYAALAARHNVDIFCVGSELSSMEDKDAFWRTLIADIRAIYPGKLIYSANWDHYEHPKFWDDLDYIGVSSYFEIAKKNADPIHTMTGRWVGFRQKLLNFARDAKRPLILTEVGYPTIDSSAVKPWDYTAKTPPNQNAQLAAFRSLASTWTLEPSDSAHFAGLFVWHGWGPGGEHDTSYSIWEKYSHDFVRRWFDKPN